MKSNRPIIQLLVSSIALSAFGAEKEKSADVSDYPFWSAKKRGFVAPPVPGLNAVLGLSDAQVREIAAAREAMANDADVRAARGVSKADPQREQARATVEAATTRLRKKVATILTAEQRALIDKIDGLHAAAVEETAILYGPRFGTVKNDEAARLRLHEEVRNATDEVFRRNLERDLTAEQKAAMARAAEEEAAKRPAK